MTDISIELIDHMGSDLSVVNAARVSFEKKSDWVYCVGSDGRDKGLSGADKKLISYLARHNHKSPFNHCFASFRVKAPIFVARQLVKHEYMPWNEISRRYVDSEPEFYTPHSFRLRANNVKQGSSNESIGADTEYRQELDIYQTYCRWFYEDLLEAGVCPEQARMVLPQSMMTEWIWSGSLFAIAKMCKLRLDPHTQYETRIVAKEIAAHMETIYPVSWKALMNDLAN